MTTTLTGSTTGRQKTKNKSKNSKDWRIRNRIRTVSAALLMCLHLGIDPPDANKPNPHSSKISWIDTEHGESSDHDEQARSTLIIKALQAQYEQWQSRARYKALIDPVNEDLKRCLQSLRKASRSERILLHYNGYGVPKATENGELWFFNQSFTQYVPVGAQELLEWVQMPVLMVLDCSCAGNIIDYFRGKHALSHSRGQGRDDDGDDGSAVDVRDEGILIVAASSSGQSLPMHPALPADIFTSALTTPIKMAIHWHIFRAGGSPLTPTSILKLSLIVEGGDGAGCVDDGVFIPGRTNDRKSVLGTLLWILTAITDTIAWSVLGRAVFKRLYRQDVMVASIFRNFLLAARILGGGEGCDVDSIPQLPIRAIINHRLWSCWDHILDCTLMGALDGRGGGEGDDSSEITLLFWTSQMDAFESCAKQILQIQPRHHLGSSPLGGEGETRSTLHASLTALCRDASDQLPILLQALLCQSNRERALGLLCLFVDAGEWALLDCLHVGIFPYLLKLFQSRVCGQGIVHSLLYLWVRLLSFDANKEEEEGEEEKSNDNSIAMDLVKGNSYDFFVKRLLMTADSCQQISSNEKDADRVQAQTEMLLACLSLFLEGIIGNPENSKGKTVSSGLEIANSKEFIQLLTNIAGISKPDPSSGALGGHVINTAVASIMKWATVILAQLCSFSALALSMIIGVNGREKGEEEASAAAEMVTITALLSATRFEWLKSKEACINVRAARIALIGSLLLEEGIDGRKSRLINDDRLLLIDRVVEWGCSDCSALVRLQSCLVLCAWIKKRSKTSIDGSDDLRDSGETERAWGALEGLQNDLVAIISERARECIQFKDRNRNIDESVNSSNNAANQSITSYLVRQQAQSLIQEQTRARTGRGDQGTFQRTKTRKIAMDTFLARRWQDNTCSKLFTMKNAVIGHSAVDEGDVITAIEFHPMGNFFYFSTRSGALFKQFIDENEGLITRKIMQFPSPICDISCAVDGEVVEGALERGILVALDDGRVAFCNDDQNDDHDVFSLITSWHIQMNNDCKKSHSAQQRQLKAIACSPQDKVFHLIAGGEIGILDAKSKLWTAERTILGNSTAADGNNDNDNNNRNEDNGRIRKNDCIMCITRNLLCVGFEDGCVNILNVANMNAKEKPQNHTPKHAALVDKFSAGNSQVIALCPQQSSDFIWAASVDGTISLINCAMEHSTENKALFVHTLQTEICSFTAHSTLGIYAFATKGEKAEDHTLQIYKIDIAADGGGERLKTLLYKGTQMRCRQLTFHPRLPILCGVVCDGLLGGMERIEIWKADYEIPTSHHHANK